MALSSSAGNICTLPPSIKPETQSFAMTACRWITDAEVPTGRYLVPGCWNRVICGDDAECQCSDRPETMQEQIDRLQAEIEQLKMRNP